MSYYDNLGLSPTGAPGVNRNDVKDTIYVQNTFISNVGANINESAANPQTTTAGNGTVWVRNDVPNTLIFTDDAGTDHDVSGPGAVEDLATTLVAGNVTGGTDIVVSVGDVITSAGALPITAATNLTATSSAGNLSLISTTGNINSTSATNWTATSTGGNVALTSTTGSVSLVSSTNVVATTSAGNIGLTSTTGSMTANIATNIALNATTGSITSTASAGNINLNATAGIVNITSPNTNITGDVQIDNVGAQVNLVLEGDNNTEKRLIALQAGAANGWEIYGPAGADGLIITQKGTSAGTNFELDTTGNLAFTNVNTGLQMPSGDITQTTSVTTPVISHAHRGAITMVSFLATTVNGVFTVTNDYCTATSQVQITVDEQAAPIANWGVTAIANGSFGIRFNNDTLISTGGGVNPPIIYYHLIN